MSLYITSIFVKTIKALMIYLNRYAYWMTKNINLIMKFK